VSELALKHQGEEIAANRASTRQAVFRSQYHFSRKPEDFPVNWRADYGRYILVFGNKGSGYDNVKARLRSTFGDSLARSVDFSSPHERACSAIKARASRASRLRCLRNKAPSLALIFCLAPFQRIGARLYEQGLWGSCVLMTFGPTHLAALKWHHRSQSFSCKTIIAAVSDCAQGLILVLDLRQ
jgi:hypothetical protein